MAGSRLAFLFDSDPVQSTLKVTDIDVSKATVALSIPSSTSGTGTLEISGVYWITAGSGESAVRAYGSISVITETTGKLTATIDESGGGMRRIPVTFTVPASSSGDTRTIYNVYAKYTSADGSYTVQSPLAFAEDPAFDRTS